jgi:hypothetical protein
MTTLVNLRHIRFHSEVPPIDRSTIFGNPFLIEKDGTREEVIAKYRIWFYKKLEDPKFRQAVKSLRGKTLACWCSPLPCHGDIILEYLNE